jgi:tripartite-type tricarboxylate transporter receptor subunit TctC
MSAPKGTSPEIVAALNKAVNEVLKDPQVIARFAVFGGVPQPMTPEQYGELIASETEKWRKVVAFAGVSVD